jgi:outer membrane protein assembly factor BamB
MKLPLQIILTFGVFLFGVQIVCRAQDGGTNLWTLKIANQECDSSPALAPDGTIYQATFDGKLLAVTPQGEIKWTFKAGREIKSSPAVGSDGTIYFGSRDRKFYAVTPQGKLEWTFATGAWVDSSPAIAADGTIYFGSWDKNFYALNPDGSKKWVFVTGGIVDSSPAIGGDGTIYFGSHDKALYALAPDGKLRWSFLTQGQIISSPAVNSDGTIYFSSTDGNLYALDSGGAEKWRLHTGGVTASSPVLDSQGLIYLAVNNFNTAVTKGGTNLWARPSNLPIDASPTAVANETVYFSSPWHELLTLGSNGDFNWQLRLDNFPKDSPIIAADGTIYLSAGRFLYAVTTTNSPPLAKSSWPMFRATPQHTGRVQIVK